MRENEGITKRREMTCYGIERLVEEIADMLYGSYMRELNIIEIEEIRKRYKSSGDTPLHLAAFLGKVKNIKALIKGRGKVNAKNDGGYTALHCASIMSCEKTARELIIAGSDVNTGNYIGRTPLDGAVFMREIKNVRTILEAGGDVNEKDHKDTFDIYGK